MMGCQSEQSAMIKRASKSNENVFEISTPSFFIASENFCAKVAVPPMSFILKGKNNFIYLETYSFEGAKPFWGKGDEKGLDDALVFEELVIVAFEVF